MYGEIFNALIRHIIDDFTLHRSDLTANELNLPWRLVFRFSFKEIFILCHLTILPPLELIMRGAQNCIKEVVYMNKLVSLNEFTFCAIHHIIRYVTSNFIEI